MAWRAGGLCVALAALAACAGDDATPTTTTPYTGPARVLAPSQVSQPTVPEPTIPDLCAPGAIEIDVRAGDQPDADAIVVFRNVGAVECEVDLGTAWAIAHQIEPSVRLVPGGTAQLWGVAGACDDPTPTWDLTVNGARQPVDLPAPTCTPTPTAFFPTSGF